MAKKTLALALLLLSACSLSAAKLVSGVEILPSVSLNKFESTVSYSTNTEVGISLCLETGQRAVFGASAGAEKAVSILNPDRFSSAGDYGGLYLKVFWSLCSFLTVDAGVRLLVPQAYGSMIIPAFNSGVSFRRTAPLGESLVLCTGAGVSVSLGRSFASYRFGFSVMGLWRR